MNPKLVLGAVAVVALFVFGVALSGRPSVHFQDTQTAASTETQAQTQTQTQVQPAPQPTPSTATSVSTHASGYTMAEVAAHSSASSCWTAINGNVYDLTNWINQHPGGPEAIMSLCGTDGSAAFNAQHGGQRRPANELSSFYIGTLAS